MEDVFFLLLTHPESDEKIAVRADAVYAIEPCGEGNSLLSLANGEAFICKEGVDEVLSQIFQP